ncbi:MAG: type II CRISPR-associated endonuclease Cas1 [Ureaplasma sp.]|nr:type II CRISPR-associated endonuclease Cas1 [Ureaplasma sp.]
MGWKIIEIDKPCLLKTFLNNLLIIKSEKIVIPIQDIDTLLIDNTQISISINLITELTEAGVNIIICNNKHLPTSILTGINVKKQNYEVFHEQLNWSNDYKKQCWKTILKYKLKNQIDLMKRYELNLNNWEKIINMDIDPYSNLESQLANLFFHQMYGHEFNRDQKNQVNYLMDYGYVVITSMVVRSIIKKGLNQHISFFHGSKYSSFPLAYDIVEPFRIIIDYFVKEMYNNEMIYKLDMNIESELKSCLLDYVANYRVKMDNNYQYLNNAIDIFIDWIIKQELESHTMEFIFDVK